MNFSGIQGHDFQKTVLKSLHSTGRIPQTLLFTGIPGIGKKMIALRFLMSLFCKDEETPCLRCKTCQQLSAGTHPDFINVAPNERGSIPIGSEEKKEEGSVRWLINRLSKKPVAGRYAVIVDGVSTISEEGQNALLKTIEEPSITSTIILISSSRMGILPTIISRSFEIKYNPLSLSDIDLLLSEKGYPDDMRQPAALLSGGSPLLGITFAERDNLESLLAAARDISRCIDKNSLLSLDTEAIIKKSGREILLDGLLNLYRTNLMVLLGIEKDFSEPLSDIFLDDEQKILELMKIFVALKKGQSNNLNFRLALKGMLYSLYTETCGDGRE